MPGHHVFHQEELEEFCVEIILHNKLCLSHYFLPMNSQHYFIASYIHISSMNSQRLNIAPSQGQRLVYTKLGPVTCLPAVLIVTLKIQFNLSSMLTC